MERQEVIAYQADLFTGSQVSGECHAAGSEAV